MTTLKRALTFEQVHDLPVMVAEDLDLDVARPLDQALDVEGAVAERRHRFAARRRDQRQRILAGRGPCACPCRRRPPTP